MNYKKMFSTRIDPCILKNLKHLSVEEEVSINRLMEEAIRDLLCKYDQINDARLYRMPEP